MIGIMRDRKPKGDAEPTSEGGPVPDELERATKAIEQDLREAATRSSSPSDEWNELEGELAAADVFVNGKTVRLSTLRTQEHVGLLLAAATREQLEAEAHYRAWRARKGVELCLNAKKELQQWRVKQRLEAMPDFLTFKTGLARAAANVIALQTVYETWGDE